MSTYIRGTHFNIWVGCIKRAQSSMLTEVLMASAALIIGMSILAYFSSFSSGYSGQLELSNLINYEAANQVVRTIAYDNTSRTAWLLLRRLDGTPRNFLAIVSVGDNFLGCESVYIYAEPQDGNGIVCDEAGVDCVSSCNFYSRSVSSREPIVWTKDGPIPLYDYLRRQAPPQVGLIRIPYPNPAAGYRTQNIIVKVELGQLSPTAVRVYLGIEHDGKIYVVRIYEVNLV